MPTYSDNNVPVVATDYTDALARSFDQPAHKLTLQVEGGAVYVQTKESITGSFTGGAQQRILPGFRSITTATPIYGFRLRSAGVPATVDWTYYA